MDSPFAHEKIVLTSSPQGLSRSIYWPEIGGAFRRAEVYVEGAEGQTARWDVGQDPVPGSEGEIAEAGGRITLESVQEMEHFRAVLETGSTTITLRVRYVR